MPKGPWDKYAPDAPVASTHKSGPWDKYAPDTPDYSDNSKKEGLYEMRDSKGVIQKVPYSKVEDAFKTGLRFQNPAGVRQYTKDREHEGPSALSRFAEAEYGAIGNAAKGAVQLLDPRATEEEKQQGLTRPVDVLMRYPERLIRPNLEEADKAGDSSLPVNERIGSGIASVLPLAGPWMWNTAKQMMEQAGSGNYAGASGTAVGNAMVAEAPKAIGKVAKAAVKAAPAAIRSTAEALTKTGPAELKKLAQETQRANQEAATKARVDNEKATAKHLEDSSAAAHETTGKELQSKTENTAAKVESLKKEREAAAKHQADVEEVRKHNDSVLRDRKKRADTEQKLDNASKELEQKYAEAEVKANRDNDAAWDEVRSKTKDAHTDIAPLKSIVKAASSLADPASSPIFKSILNESAEGDGANLTHDEQGRPIVNGEVRKVGSDSYEFPVTHPDYAKVYEAQYGEPPPPLPKLTNTERPVIADGKEVLSSDPKYPELYEAQYGEPPPLNEGATPTTNFSRLQRWYTYLGEKMYSGGRLEAGTYNALKMTRAAIDQAMGKIAEETGATKDLQKARKLHTEKMETFHDSPNDPATVASKSLQETTPEHVKEQKAAERLKKVSNYDTSIAQLAAHVENLRAGLKTLPKEAPLRDQVKPIPPAPAPVAPPKLSYPDRNLGPDRPVEVQPKQDTITPQDIQQQRGESIEKFANRLREMGVRRALYTAATGLTGALTAAFLGHPLLGAAADAGAGTAVLVGSHVLANLLEKPEVVDWLSKVSPKDVAQWEKLPPEQKALFTHDMSALAQAAQAKKIFVSPALSAFIAGTAADQNQPKSPEQIKKEADELQKKNSPEPISYVNNPLYPAVQHALSAMDKFSKNYSQTATGPNGHKIGSNDGHSWFDVQTGQQV